MLNQPNFLAKLNPSKTLLNPQPRPKGDIKSTLEAARQRRLAMEQRNSREVEQVVIVMMVVMVVMVVIMMVATMETMMVLVDDVANFVAANKMKIFVRKLRRCRLETYYWWNR